MKRIFYRSFILILIAVLAVSFLPITASAADNELVLTKIGHSKTDTVSISDPSLRAVTLTAPYKTAGSTIDLSTGLIVDKASTSISSVITSFDTGSVATIGAPGTPGPAVVMTVKYSKTSDPSTLITTKYSISVVRAAMKSPTFSGTLSKSVSSVMPNTETHDVTFSASDFTALYSANDGADLGAVSFEGSNLLCGNLLYSNAPFTPGSPIPVTALSNLWFDATAAGNVSYIVRAYAGTDYSTPIGSALLNIKVSGVTVPTITGSVSKSVNTGATVTFSASDFTNLSNLNGGTFAGVEITPTNSGYGTWYNGTSTFTGTTPFTAATIGNLKFTGSIAGAASFTWKISNEAGPSTAGSGSITVTSGTINITYSTTQNNPKVFAASDFYTPFANTTGYALNYIYFTSLPSSSYGTLYYGYSTPYSPGSAVTASSAYFYSGSPAISSIAFVPASGFTGTISIPYVAVATNGTTTYTGMIQITVSGGATSITYSTAQNTPKVFSASDFYTPFYNATNNPLYYIYFSSLPSSAYGTLYSGYTSPSSPGSAVAASSAFYYNISPAISSVAFVPASGFSGTVSIPYVAVATNGTTTFTGTIQITVSGGSMNVTYSTAQNTPKLFSASDFYTPFANSTGCALNYIYFSSLPSSSNGTLYYGYTSASSPGAAVSASSALYYSGSPAISTVSFVPASGFTGTVSIPYVAVATNNSTYLTGTIQITVSGGSMNITYSTAANTPKVFSAADFYTPFYNATGNPLYYIYFSSLPSSSYGTLYTGYSSPSSPGSAASASSPLYYSNTPAISSVAFVPASGYSGTVSIPYVAVATNNTTYLTGTIQITVSGGSMNITYSTAANTPKVFSAADFYTPFYSATGNPLYYIYFSSLPSSSNGTLYTGYSSASSPGTAISASSALYYNSSPAISSVAFVPASGYSGTVSIPYVAVATNNSTYLTGTIQITVSGGSMNITYSTTANSPKLFSAADFYTPFYNATGNPLYYIYFSSLPSSSYGTLYTGYSSASSPGTAAGASSAIYYSSSPAISSVAFVPASGYSGTVSIPYVAVATNNSTYLTGTIQITVSGSANITYTTTQRTPKVFSASDFYTPFYNATGNPLYYIYFSSLPASSYGTLYTGYTSASSPGTAAAASSAIYYSGSPAISSVAFVPASGYSGTVSIPYVAVATNNSTYITGTIQITVSGGSSSSAYFTDVGASYSWAVDGIDYLYSLKVVNGTGNGLYSPANAMTRGDFLLMLYRLVGYRTTSTANFTDVPKSSYYYEAIAAAKAHGIAIGTNNTISPTVPVTRQDAMLWVYRALGVKGITVPAGSSADIADFSDKGNIASYALNAVEALVKGGIIKGADGKLLPTGNLSRAEMAVILARVAKTYLSA